MINTKFAANLNVNYLIKNGLGIFGKGGLRFFSKK